MTDKSKRQDDINQMYAAFRMLGDDDTNARARVVDTVNEIFAAPLRAAGMNIPPAPPWVPNEAAKGTVIVDAEAYLKHGTPVTEEELDAAQAAYGADDDDE